MPNNRLDPTSILLRSYLHQVVYISVAPSRRTRMNIIEQECIHSYRYSYFLFTSEPSNTATAL
jgi:hypothetical protein